MSNDLINIRFFSWHFHWPKSHRPYFSRNDYHKFQNWPDGYISVYDFFGLK